MPKLFRGPFQVISSRHIYSNPWITVREDKVIRPGGTESVFGVVDLMAGASVLALTDDHKVYLAKEYKYGVQQHTVELVSGGLEPGEKPLETAQRELREEFGLEAREWVDMGLVNPFTNVINSPSYLFLALGVRQEHEPRPDPGEDIELVKLPFQQVVDMVLNNEITNGSSCTLILKAHFYLQTIGQVK